MDDLPAGGPSEEGSIPQGPHPAPRRLLGAVRLRGAIDAVLRHEWVWAVGTVLLLLLLTWRPPWGKSFGELFEGRIADSDVTAPFDVEIRDEVRTDERRQQARRAVDDIYVFDDKAGVRIERDLQDNVPASALPGSPDPAVGAILRRGHGEVLRAVRGIVRTVFDERLIVARPDTLPQGRSISVRSLGELEAAPLRDPSRIIDLEEAKRRMREAAGGIPGLDPAAAGVLGDWLASLVQPTLTYDMEETRRRMDEAARQVPVLYSRLPKGTVLVRKGQPYTSDVIREIQAVQHASPRGFDPTALFGVTLVALFMVFFLWRYSSDWKRELRRVPHLFPFLALALGIHAAVGRGAMALIEVLVKNMEFPFDRPETFWYLIPAASGALLVALLANDRIATVYSMFAAAVFAIIFDWNLSYSLFVLITHLTAVYGLSKYHSRTALMRSGLVIGIAGAAAVAGLDAINSGFNPWQVCLADAVFAFLGGVVGVPLLVAFLLPIFEWLFGILTDIRLLELSNLDNPLLSQLAVRAPGSYNHSIIVGTLAEAAAESIGANPLFCRVAAYYHDIGKMRMPEYYIENQRPGDNPHDRLAPSMSALIITNHVKEGLKMGREHGLPEPILDIIPQHHGTRVMTYFFERAKSAATAAGVPPPNPDDFRHPGPKPSTKEAAIFMLSDSVEAAARTVVEPTDERFRDLIRQIASRAILDGQFDQCDLTFRDLDHITEAFVRSLGSIYHHRIDYPTFIFEGTTGRRATRAEHPGAHRTRSDGPS